MKTALIFLAIAIVLLFLFWLKVDVWFGDSTIDIHFHDTYFVIACWHFILFVFLILGTFSSLGGIIGTKFKNKLFIAVLLIFLAVDAYIIWNLYSAFHHS